MSTGRRDEQWRQLSQLSSVVHNAACIKEKDLKSPDYFNIHEKSKGELAKPGRKLSFKEKVAAAKPFFVRQ